jgi:hypothetical protein
MLCVAAVALSSGSTFLHLPPAPPFPMSNNSDSNHAPATSVPRPKRIPVASNKLLDSSNTAAPSLSSHKQAIEAHRQAEESTDHRDQDRSLAPLSNVPNQISMPMDPQSSSPGTDFQDHPGDATNSTNSDSKLVEIPKSKSYLIYMILA